MVKAAEIRVETERLRKQAEQRIETGREQLAASLEPSGKRASFRRS